ncbi:MAG: hypothetical protein WCI74_12265, partial [Actinomycetes bacterium]
GSAVVPGFGRIMSRIVWVGVGAIGGVIVYRRGQRAVNEARDRGLVGNVQHAALTISSVANGANRLIALASAANANAHSSSADRLALEQDAARWRQLADGGVGIEAGVVDDPLPAPTTKRSLRSTARKYSALGSSDTVDLRSQRTVRIP